MKTFLKLLTILENKQNIIHCFNLGFEHKNKRRSLQSVSKMAGTY